MKKPKAYIWDYRHKKDETYDSGGWILVDKDKGFSIVVEVHEYTPRPAYKIESTELTELEIELVNKKSISNPPK